jgi:hypothetical protein
MKYFTKEMWLGWNSSDDEEWQRADEQNKRNWLEYQQQFEKLQSRLGPEAYHFFKNEERHDGRLIAFTVGDAINHDVHGALKFDINKHDTTVEIKLIGPELDVLYTLHYKGVKRVIFDYPTDTPLFYEEGDHISDWGYDEVTAVDENYLRHEVLFSTGTTILIEFKHFSYEREDCEGTRYQCL